MEIAEIVKYFSCLTYVGKMVRGKSELENHLNCSVSLHTARVFFWLVVSMQATEA